MSGDPWAERRAVADAQYRRDPNRFAGAESNFARWIVPRLAAPTGARLVELGCGPGRDLCYYARQGLLTTGIDHAEAAVDGARQRVGMLLEPARSRARVVHGEALATLLTLPERSQDAVVAHLVYGSFSSEELRLLGGAIARCLRPRGTHAFAVRSTTDPRCGTGSQVGPDTFLGGPHEVAHRYFTLESAKAIAGGLFAVEETSVGASEHVLYLRTRLAPSGTAASPTL